MATVCPWVIGETGPTMNSWRKQRKACLISLVLAFALAACDVEPEQKSDSEAPQDSITENQTTANPPADNQEAIQQETPAASSGTTGEEPTAGGESIPPDESAEPVPEVAQDAGPPPPQPVPTPPVVEAPPSPARPPAKPPGVQPPV